MQGYSIDESTTRVRWVLAGSFSPKGQKKCVEVNKNTFADKLTAAELALEVSVPDRFGSDDTRRFTVTFAKLKDFTLKAVIDMVPGLKAMNELATKLGRAGAPEPDAVMQTVTDAFGPGRLAAGLVELFAGGDATAKAATSAKNRIASRDISGASTGGWSSTSSTEVSFLMTVEVMGDGGWGFFSLILSATGSGGTASRWIDGGSEVSETAE